MKLRAGTKYYLLSSVVLFALQTIGQTPTNTSKVNTAAGTKAVNLPGAYQGGVPVNSVRTRIPQQPFAAASDVMNTGRTATEVQETVQYLDGLGRPLQTVGRRMSPNQTDVVTPVVYDAFGQEQYKYLPYTAPSSDGSFKSDPFGDQSAFYTGSYATQQPALQGEQYYYGKTAYEASPLNRVQKTFAPGNNWAGSEGSTNEHAVEVHYLTNNGSDNVRIWTIPDNADFTTNIPVSPGGYAAGNLIKTVSLNEHKHATVEYKDKEGKVILKKVQIGNNINADYSGQDAAWLCTYYVYDNLERLRFVIPPKATAAIQPGWSFTGTGTLIDELCFRYEYDGRGRMTAKKVPGAAWGYMVYDTRDRLVFMQDGNMGAKGWWMVTVYDELNRPVKTGMLTGYTTTKDALQSYVNGVSPQPLALPGGSLIELTQTFYDTYTGATQSFVNNAGKLDKGSNPYADPAATGPSSLIKGIVTRTRVRVIENPNDLSFGAWLETTTYYDDKGRVIQTVAGNYKGGTDRTTNLYDFTGKAVCNYMEHSNPAAGATVKVKTNTEYDHAGRVTQVTKLVNDDAATKRIVSRDNYDDLGQLLNKQVGQKIQSDGTILSTPLEDQRYTYNIRGWLKGINWNYGGATGTNATADMHNNKWFAMDLSYDWGYGNNQYNGNIAGMRWQASGDGTERSYNYTYDNANRLLKGDYLQKQSSLWSQSTSGGLSMNFNVRMGDINGINAYDENGNILRMQQWGLKGLASTQIDDLSYGYKTQSNKLLNVTDNVNDIATTLGDFKDENTTGNNDYDYDVNGNLNRDYNKKISSISYNHLNLPYQITVDGKGTITYVYDAASNKLKKTTEEPASNNNNNTAKTTETAYVNGYVYESSTIVKDGQTTSNAAKLQYFGQEEGRIRPVSTGAPNYNAGFAYDYFLKDHLGNTRTVLTDEVRKDFYPAATLEGNINDPNSAVYVENQYYTIDPSNITDNRPGSITGGNTYYNNNGIANNNPNITSIVNNASAKSYKLNGAGGGKTGLGITLKVMAGDKIDIWGKSYYEVNNSGDNANNNLPLLNILSGLLGTPAVSGIKQLGVTASGLNGVSSLTSAVADFLTSGSRLATASTKPRAYINYIVFDEQLQFVTGNLSQIGNVGAVKNHHDDVAFQGIEIPKNGYLYVYCSNESPVDVYFDNLQVVHTRGALLEETAYYPFGLTAKGISSKAANMPVNHKKFNEGTELQEQEFSDGSGLDIYETNYRSLDPQIGRFLQIDPLTFLTSDMSPYAFALNNPILRNDPTGLKDSIAKLPDVTVVSHVKKLQGGEYNGQTFQQIKEVNGLYINVQKKVFTNTNAVDNLKKAIEISKSIEGTLKLVGDLGGGSIAVKSVTEMKEFIKALKEGKLTVSPVALLAAQIYIEGMKAGVVAEDLQKVVDSYIGIHSTVTNPNPPAANGVYVITSDVSVQNAGFGLSTVITTTSYYDVTTKQYLGETKSR